MLPHLAPPATSLSLCLFVAHKCAAGRSPQLQKYAEMRTKLERPRKLFHTIDIDGDGVLSRMEFHRLLADLKVTS